MKSCQEMAQVTAQFTLLAIYIVSSEFRDAIKLQIMLSVEHISQTVQSNNAIKLQNDKLIGYIYFNQNLPCVIIPAQYEVQTIIGVCACVRALISIVTSMILIQHDTSIGLTRNPKPDISISIFYVCLPLCSMLPQKLAYKVYYLLCDNAIFSRNEFT